MLNEEMPAVVQCDIKQNQSEESRPVAVRLYPSLTCPTCKPPRDANREKGKRPEPAVVMQGKQRRCQNQKQALAKKTKD
jgi:hypothetical protein